MLGIRSRGESRLVVYLSTRFRPMRGPRVPAKSALTLAEYSNDLGDQPRPEIPLESGYLSGRSSKGHVTR